MKRNFKIRNVFFFFQHDCEASEIHCFCIYRVMKNYSQRVVYKINTCYIFQATYFQIPVEERKIERERESTAGGFLVSALCALAWLGPSYASVTWRATALHRQYNTHTHKHTHIHSQLGLPVIRQHEERTKCTLSQNHAFINTFTLPKLSSLQDATQWHGGKQLDSLKCRITSAVITNPEGL